MIKIEIHDDLIDWLEERVNLPREECAEFAQEFVSYVMATDAMTIETPDLLAERDALRAALADLESAAGATSRLLSKLSVIAFNDNADNDLPYGLAEEVRAWVRSADIDKALQQARAALDAAEEAA